MKIGILYRPTLKEVANHIRDKFDAAYHEVVFCEDATKSALTCNLFPTDMIAVVGGDGTILNVIRSMGLNQKPVIGIHYSDHPSTLGYLTHFTEASLESALDNVLTPDYCLISQRMLLEYSTNDGINSSLNELCVNEVAVKDNHRLIELKICVNGDEFAHMRGDGVIIATATGSTAYNMSAGGPILHPEIESIIITPIAAHSLSLKPVVIHADSVVDITIMPHGRLCEAVSIIDGQEKTPLAKLDHSGFCSVRVQKSRVKAKIVMNEEIGVWDTLREKLKWG